MLNTISTKATASSSETICVLSCAKHFMSFDWTCSKLSDTLQYWRHFMEYLCYFSLLIKTEALQRSRGPAVSRAFPPSKEQLHQTAEPRNETTAWVPIRSSRSRENADVGPRRWCIWPAAPPPLWLNTRAGRPRCSHCRSRWLQNHRCKRRTRKKKRF